MKYGINEKFEQVRADGLTYSEDCEILKINNIISLIHRQYSILCCKIVNASTEVVFRNVSSSAGLRDTAKLMMTSS